MTKKKSRHGKRSKTHRRKISPKKKREVRKGSRQVKRLNTERHTDSPTFNISRAGPPYSATRASTVSLLNPTNPISCFNCSSLLTCNKFLVGVSSLSIMNRRSSNWRIDILCIKFLLWRISSLSVLRFLMGMSMFCSGKPSGSVTLFHTLSGMAGVSPLCCCFCFPLKEGSLDCKGDAFTIVFLTPRKAEPAREKNSLSVSSSSSFSS